MAGTDVTEGEGLSFKGKKVLVTGASSGIGAALAEAFALDGAVVGMCARRKERLDRDVRTLCRSTVPAAGCGSST